MAHLICENFLLIIVNPFNDSGGDILSIGDVELDGQKAGIGGLDRGTTSDIDLACSWTSDFPSPRLPPVTSTTESLISIVLFLSEAISQDC